MRLAAGGSEAIEQRKRTAPRLLSAADEFEDCELTHLLGKGEAVTVAVTV